MSTQGRTFRLLFGRKSRPFWLDHFRAPTGIARDRDFSKPKTLIGFTYSCYTNFISKLGANYNTNAAAKTNLDADANTEANTDDDSSADANANSLAKTNDGVEAIVDDRVNTDGQFIIGADAITTINGLRKNFLHRITQILLSRL